MDAYNNTNDRNNTFDDNRSSASSARAVAPLPPSAMATPYSGIIQKHINDDGYESDNGDVTFDKPVFGLSSIIGADMYSQLRRGKSSHNSHNADNAAPATTQQQAMTDDDSLNNNNTSGEDEKSLEEEEDGDHYPLLSPLQQKFRHHVKISRGISRFLLIFILTVTSKFVYKSCHQNKFVLRLSELPYKSTKSLFSSSLSGGSGVREGGGDPIYPEFVFDHPYVTSSYYTSTSNTAILEKMNQIQVEPKKDRLPDRERGIVSRLAILRPFCEFDAEALPTTFACWNSLVPCRAAEQDLGDDGDDEDNIDEWVLFDMSTNGTGRKLSEDEQDEWECEADYGSNSNSTNTATSFFRGIANSFFKRCKRKPKTKDYFDDVPADGLRTTSADLFLFYSQTFSENDVAMKAVDKIMEEFFSPGGWSRCFDNIYAVEANIPQELDLYIPAAQEELYNWVNGPNRQYEAGFRIIQSGEWGDYDGFYLMEGDSVPVKNYWLDVILGEINAYRPFAVLGA